MGKCGRLHFRSQSWTVCEEVLRRQWNGASNVAKSKLFSVRKDSPIRKFFSTRFEVFRAGLAKERLKSERSVTFRTEMRISRIKICLKSASSGSWVLKFYKKQQRVNFCVFRRKNFRHPNAREIDYPRSQNLMGNSNPGSNSTQSERKAVGTFTNATCRDCYQFDTDFILVLSMRTYRHINYVR